MYKLWKKGYILIEQSPPIRQTRKSFRITYDSKLWRIWRAVITPNTCFYCFFMSGRILSVDDDRLKEIPVHRNCACSVEVVTAIEAGTATESGVDGVDLFVALYGQLPTYYLTQDEAKEQGWKKWKGNLAEVLPGKSIGGDVYQNRERRLPTVPDRIWYEADFDYNGGFRNQNRILFSNDGLIFVTYDHYLTFYEIATEMRMENDENDE